ncbi:hypothetical protein ACIRP5_33835 [Streptomyces sp. NPDC101221]|uniref:hypothetical protein n=1 Tax=Streptomyces sp. NPDC101221 TaxID=3366132 RepID=UPI00382D79C7
MQYTELVLYEQVGAVTMCGLRGPSVAARGSPVVPEERLAAGDRGEAGTGPIRCRPRWTATDSAQAYRLSLEDRSSQAVWRSGKPSYSAWMGKRGYCQGPYCEAPLPDPGPTGRPQKYCSARCKGQAYRYRRSDRLDAAKEEALRIESYPNAQAILERIVSERYTADELLLILTVVENQFVAERVRRSPIAVDRSTVWLGNTELAAVERQLRRILLRITGHRSRQPEGLKGDPDKLRAWNQWQPKR